MIYTATMQLGYYEDDDTYHGPFSDGARFEAQSIEEAVVKAKEALRINYQKYQEPDNMMSGAVLEIHDSNGKLVFDHALGILAEEASLAKSDDEVRENVLARIQKDPLIGRRARAAIKAAGIEAVKSMLGPLGSIIIAAVEAWNDPGDSE